MKSKFIFLALGCLSMSASAWGAEYKQVETLPLKAAFGTTKDWHVSAYQTTAAEPEFTEDAARLCFTVGHEKSDCTDITSALPNMTTRFAYQQVKELSVMAKPHVVKFVAEFSGGGSGTLEQISFWRYDKSNDSFEQAALVTLGEQSEYHIYNEGPLAGLFVTANARWGKGETHFAPHQFDIDIYRRDADGDYAKQLSYLTKTKYPSLDDVDTIDVISHEVGAIQKYTAK